MNVQSSKVYEPGLHAVTEREYRQIPALSQSELKRASKDWWAYRQGLPVRKETASLRWGTFFDMLLLTPDRFLEEVEPINEQYILHLVKMKHPKSSVRDFANINRSKNAKSVYHEWLNEQKAAGRIPVLEHDIGSNPWTGKSGGGPRYPLADLRTSVAIAKGHPVCQDMLQEGKPQVALVWEDHSTKILCKALIDWLGAYLWDVKTAVDNTPDGFTKAAWLYGYHFQAAWYLWGYKSACEQSGTPLEADTNEFRFIVASNAEPFTCETYRFWSMDDSWKAIESARFRMRRALDQLHANRELDIWPRKADNLQSLMFKSWQLEVSA